ncbi:MAG: hypothetical protein V2A67_10045 [Bacteroidota bacterium]
MDSRRITTGLREKIAEIGRMLEWMEQSGHAHPIDFDLILNKTRELYELEIFFSTGMDLQKEAPVAKQEIPVTHEEATMPAAQSVTPPPVPRVVVEPPVSREVVQPRIVQEKVPEPSSPIIDFLFPETSDAPEKPAANTGSEGRLNEVLGKQKPLYDVASSITESPVNDIWSAIAINDRFLFMRELFDNDSEAFKTTVSLLNSLTSWDAAGRYISSHFNWDKNNPVVKDFQTVVRRRFL